MNKKNILKVLTITAATMAALSSCNQSAPKVDAKSDTPQKVPASLKIAYVEVDSIMSQYKFCKDYSLILQRKGQNIKSTLAAKQQQLQAAAANFQQKMQQNAYTRDQAEAINANLQKQNADLQMLDQRLTNEFQNETEKYNNALRDSIQHYLKIYNQDKHYSLILSKAGDMTAAAAKK